MNSGWQAKTIDAVCEIVNGGTPKTGVPEFWGGGQRWITPAEMGKRLTPYVSTTERTLTDAGLESCSASLLPKYSVILSSRAPIGHLVINKEPMATNQGCKGLIPGNQLHYKFLYYYLHSNVDLLNSLGTGATFKELSGGKLKEVPIPIPPLVDQKRIADVLDKTFDGIATAKANAEKNLQNARALFDSYLQSVFSNRSLGWERKRLGDEDLIELIDGDRGVNYPKATDYLQQGHCLFLSTKNVRPDGFNFDSTVFLTAEKDRQLRKGKLKRGDVILTTRGTIGNVALYSEDVTYNDIRINSGMLIFRPNTQSLQPAFLFELLRSDIVKEQIKKYKTGAAQPQLPIKTLVNFTIPVPVHLGDQRAIVEKVRAFEREKRSLVAIYQKKHDALVELKTSILNHAFSGNL